MTIEWRNERRRLGDLVGWDRNPREIGPVEAERLADSLARFGQVQAIAIGPNGEIYDGHQRQRVWAAIDELGPNFEVDVRVASRVLTEDERKRLVVYLHRGTNADWNWPAVQRSFSVEDLTAWGFEEDEIQFDRIAVEPYRDRAQEQLDQQLAGLDGNQEVEIVISVAAMYAEQVRTWLANGESDTAPGRGKGVLRRCGIL